MNTREVLKKALKDCDREEFANFPGMSFESLHNPICGDLSYLPKRRNPNILERKYLLIDIIQKTTGNMLVRETIVEELSCLLIEKTAIPTTGTPAIVQIAAILKEFAYIQDNGE